MLRVTIKPKYADYCHADFCHAQCCYPEWHGAITVVSILGWRPKVQPNKVL
jgi:hypothetical protein